MATISITVSTATATDFNKMAKERGYANWKALIVSWATGQLASWRAEKLIANTQQVEFTKLEGEIA